MRARRRRVYFPEKRKNGEKRDVRTSAFIGSTKRVGVCLTGFKRPPIFLPAVLAMKILSFFFYFSLFFFSSSSIPFSTFLASFLSSLERNEFRVIEYTRE